MHKQTNEAKFEWKNEQKVSKKTNVLLQFKQEKIKFIMMSNNS